MVVVGDLGGRERGSAWAEVVAGGNVNRRGCSDACEVWKGGLGMQPAAKHLHPVCLCSVPRCARMPVVREHGGGSSPGLGSWSKR